MLEGEKKQFLDWINESQRIVFFGGAGVSTESGIPDFRSEDGLYHQKYKFSPETILSHSFFMNHKTEFFDFYREKMICVNAKPNITHIKLAELEEQGILSAIITQNIDGLHQLAGSKKVLELHGSTLRNYCIKCHKFYDRDMIIQTKGIPVCHCGGLIKPDVVLYEERLNEQVMKEALTYIENADMLIVGGTSLTVYPAAGMVRYYQGHKLVLINQSETAFDEYADLILPCGLGEVFESVSL